jgi:hypothetical protein
LSQTLTNLIDSGEVSKEFAKEAGFGNLMSVKSQVI